MCGIIGGIGEVEFDFNSMISELSHRGPDSNGLYQERNLFLCHTSTFNDFNHYKIYFYTKL